jgi:hypothetical protein
MSLLFASIRLGALGSESQEGQNFAITRLRKRANQPLTTKSRYRVEFGDGFRPKSDFQ